MDIKAYIAKTQKQYRLRLRTVVAIDDAAMDAIERAVAKYDPIEIARPRKTIMQANPVDFPNIPFAEVFILDMAFALPCTPQLLSDAVRRAINAPEAMVVCYSVNGAGTLYPEMQDALADIEREAAKLGLLPASVCATGEHYPEIETPPGDEFYGQAYNKTLVDVLKAVEDAKRAATTPKVVNPLFDYLDIKRDVPDDDQAFNRDVMPDAKPSDAKQRKIVSRFVSIDGTTNPQVQTVKRLYTDKKGEIVVLSRDVASV